MSFPINTRMVLDISGRQWLVKGRKLLELDDVSGVKGPKVIVTDFGDAFTRVDTVVSSKQYAEAIIEKSLRNQGDMDGASKVLILDSETNSNTTQALFSAVSAEIFAKYWTVATQHWDHCLLIPVTSLLLRQAVSKGKGCHAVVLQYEQHLDMLITFNGRARSSLRVSSSSMDEDDWQRAINYIAAEMQQVVANIGHELNSVSWVDWNPIITVVTPLKLSKKLSDALSIEISTVPSNGLKFNGEVIDGGLATLMNNAQAADAVNSVVDKSLFYTERSLPWIAGLLLAVSSALIASGLYWQNLATTKKQETSDLLAKVDNSLLSAMQTNTTSYQQDYSKNQKLDYEFIDTLHQALQLPSVAKMMNDVRESLPKGVKISLLSLDKVKENLLPSAFIVEGRIFKPLAETNADIEYMIKKLTRHGYHVEDNGLVNKENNHIFQLILTMDK